MVYLHLHYTGSPWPSADPSNPTYSTFLSGWQTFITANPSGQLTDDIYPTKCGPAINHLEPRGLKRLILNMLHPDPERRISAQGALHDRFVRNIECCCLDVEEEQKKLVGRIVDVGKKESCRMKGPVRKLHHHLPPEKKMLPQHRFDMGDGYS